jgi:[acyl-carrier-protein] S-malonyltransferase
VKRATTLNVGGAFHTPLMAPAAEGIAAALAGVPFANPVAPIVANHDGAAYADGDGWPERSAEHVTVPVRWRTSMETLATLGADAFVEVGAGSMIAGLAKRTVPDVPVLPCGTPEDLVNLAEVLAS